MSAPPHFEPVQDDVEWCVKFFDPAVCGRGYPAAITSPCPVRRTGQGFYSGLTRQ